MRKDITRNPMIDAEAARHDASGTAHKAGTTNDQARDKARKKLLEENDIRDEARSFATMANHTKPGTTDDTANVGDDDERRAVRAFAERMNRQHAKA